MSLQKIHVLVLGKNAEFYSRLKLYRYVILLWSLLHSDHQPIKYKTYKNKNKTDFSTIVVCKNI